MSEDKDVGDEFLRLVAHLRALERVSQELVDEYEKGTLHRPAGQFSWFHLQIGKLKAALDAVKP